MYNKISNPIRLKYILLAVLLFCVGVILLLTFFLMITLPFALATLTWAAIFLYLAVVRRPYSDFAERLSWPEIGKKM